eukprot:6038376-Lingulodinium_polyedra.AAC.1
MQGATWTANEGGGRQTFRNKRCHAAARAGAWLHGVVCGRAARAGHVAGHPPAPPSPPWRPPR